MITRSKFQRGAVIFMILFLLCSLAMPASAAKVEQTQVQSVSFSAIVPPDFNQVIVITAISSETGYLYTYYLRPETNYVSQPFMVYGQYSIAATISSSETDEGIAYRVTSEADTLTVKRYVTAPTLAFLVEGFTDTDEETPDEIPGQTPDDENDTPEDEISKEEDTPSSPSEDLAGEEAPGPSDGADHSDNQAQNEDPVEEPNTRLWKSLFFSVVAVLVFFVCGYILRRRKEG